MEITLWNWILTGVLSVVSYLLKSKMDELSSLAGLVTKTREEIARDHITRKEVDAKVDKLMARLDDGFARLESRIEQLRKEATPR